MLSRRKLGKAAAMGSFGALGGLPPRRPDQMHDTPGPAVGAGPRSIGPQPFVVIFGTGPRRGLFVYSPAPGPGNLIASITAANGVDKFGNPVRAGIAQYATVSGDDYAALLNALTSTVAGAMAAVSFVDLTNPPFVAPSFGGFGNDTGFGSESVMSSGIGVLGGGQAGVIAQDSQRAGTAGGAVILLGGQTFVATGGSSVTGALLETAGAMAAERLDVAPAAAAPPARPSGTEPWHAMTPLQNSWSNGAAVAAQYRFVASPPATVEIIGDITHASVSGSSIFFTLPAAYRPANIQSAALSFYACTAGFANAANPPRVTVAANGNVSGDSLPAGTTEISFHALISLDA